MKRQTIVKSALAGAAFSGVMSSQVFGVGAAIDSVNHAQWDENAYYNGFGGALPAGIVEGSAGFSTIGDYDGRVLSNASVTTNKVDGTALMNISTGLFSGTDVNLYEIAITNTSSFSASIPSASLILAIFNSSGSALAASVGGPLDALTGANAGINAPGLYYLGIANNAQYPENSDGQNIFGLTNTSSGVFTPVGGLTSTVLATDPKIAWYLPLGDASPLLTNTSFVAAGSYISLSGTGYAAVPEPASIGLMSIGAISLLGRRRKIVT